MKNKGFNKILLLGFIFLAFFLRYYISTMGNNFDFVSWKMVGDIVSHGQNVYEQTSRYSYGPIWAYVLGFFKQVSMFFFNDLFIFRGLIILLLSLSDLAITYWLYKRIGLLAIFLFLFNPVSIFTSGFHNQFDNVAIAIALYSFDLIEKYRSYLKGYLILGLSLIVKHVFLFFPIWLFISAKNNKQRFYSVIPIFLFFISFIPFLNSNQAMAGIWKNVFIIQRDLLYTFLPKFTLLTPVIILCFIIPFGFLFRKESVSKQALLYLLLFVATLTSSGGQYLAIPLVAYVALNPFLGLIYSSIAVQNIIFHSMRLELSLILAFQISWLVFLQKYIPKLNTFFKFIVIVSSIILTIYSLPNFVSLGKEVLVRERKNIWFMQSLYSAGNVFSISKNNAKQFLISGTIIKGRFVANQNNLGYITIPFILDNPKENFLSKGYTVTVTIQEKGNIERKYEETRALSNVLTGEGILLGFPILSDSNNKIYDISIFTNVPKNSNYLTLNLSGKVQVRYFLSKNLVNSPYKAVQFIFNKINFFFYQEANISLFFQIYSYFWIIIVLLKLIFYNKSESSKYH